MVKLTEFPEESATGLVIMDAAFKSGDMLKVIAVLVIDAGIMKPTNAWPFNDVQFRGVVPLAGIITFWYDGRIILLLGKNKKGFFIVDGIFKLRCP